MRNYVWLAAALLPAAAWAGHAPPASAESAAAAIAAAEAAVHKADGVGFAWRDSDAMIAEAREAAQKKDFAAAGKLADTARLQGELAWQQYLDQSAAVRR